MHGSVILPHRATYHSVPKQLNLEHPCWPEETVHAAVRASALSSNSKARKAVP